ncbi:MAG TPA: S26 family signal peptidase, partial [Polyangiaceae bacterium]
PSTGSDVEQPCNLEAIGGVLHKRGELPANHPQPLKSTRKLGEGKIFLVSDNRAFPYDSRRYGALDRASCKETVVFRLVGKDGFSDEKNRLTYIR